MLRYRTKARKYRLNGWLKFDQRLRAWESRVCKSVHQLGGGLNIKSNDSGTSVIASTEFLRKSVRLTRIDFNPQCRAFSPINSTCVLSPHFHSLPV